MGEKSGGLVRPENQMRSFRECLDFCALKDLGYSGLPYTWSNRRFDGPMVWVRLTMHWLPLNGFRNFQQPNCITYQVFPLIINLFGYVLMMLIVAFINLRGHSDLSQ